ncbi:MAG: hypothetical protein ABSG73_11045 [Candidatus Aminicenantales bacterium]
MVLDGSCKPFRKEIELLLKIFSMLSPGTEDLPCTIKVTADVEKDYNLLSPGGDKAQDGLRRLKDLNGVLVPSASENPSFTILISEQQFADLQYVHTLAHELVHLYDYSRFFKENGNLNLRGREEQEKAHYSEFCFWAEFHAKRVGTWFQCFYSWYGEHGLETPPDGRCSFSIDWQTKSVQEALDRFTAGRTSALANDLLWDLVLALVCYYGRLSLDEATGWDSIPDPAFPKEGLVAALGEPVLDLFTLLKRMRFYEEAVPLLPSLDGLFGKIAAKLNSGSPWWFPRPDFIDQITTVQAQMRKTIESLTQGLAANDFLKAYSDVFRALKLDKSASRDEDADKTKR